MQSKEKVMSYDGGEFLASISGYGALRRKPKFSRTRTRLRPPRYANTIQIQNVINDLETRGKRRKLKPPRKRALRRPRISAEEARRIHASVLRPSLPFFQNSITPLMSSQIPAPPLEQPVPIVPGAPRAFPGAAGAVPAAAGAAGAALRPGNLMDAREILAYMEYLRQQNGAIDAASGRVPAGSPAGPVRPPASLPAPRPLEEIYTEGTPSKPPKPDFSTPAPGSAAAAGSRPPPGTLDSVGNLPDASLDEINIAQTGDGKKIEPLSNFGLERIMAPYRQDGFVGVIAADQIPTLSKFVNRSDIMAFIMNLDTSDKPGSHWVAVWINMTNNKYGSIEVCYYDPLGDPATERTIKDLKQLLSNRIGLDVLPKFKQNLVPQQRANSNTCGYIAAQFLRRMFHGEPWSEATDYTITESERDARKLLPEGQKGGSGRYGFLYVPPTDLI